MTDLEISRRLALAIGWTDNPICASQEAIYVYVADRPKGGRYTEFDYRDWNVIGPIAAKYDCFPSGMSGGDFKKAKAQNHTDVVKWEAFAYDYKRGTEQHGKWIHVVADTPQKAIALTVIAGAKP